MNFFDKIKLAWKGMPSEELEEFAKKAKNFRKKDYSDDVLEKMK